MRRTLLVLAAAVKAARQPTVVVAGATGTVGRELVRILRRQDVPTIALGRDVLKAKRVLGIKTKCREVDLGDAEAIKAALPGDGPFRLFVATPNGPNQYNLEKTLFEVCAQTNRCEHAVKVSTATPVLEARVGPFDAHARAEALLSNSLSHTILRPSLYAQTVFSEHGPLGLPSGAGDGEHVLADASIAYVSAVDVAAVAGRVLVSDDVSRNAQKLDLTGPHATTISEVVRQAGGLVKPGTSSLETDFLRVLSTELETVSGDAEAALGEEPTAAADYFMRELRRRALDCGQNRDIAYNGRAVYTANYRSSLPFDEVRRKSVTQRDFLQFLNLKLRRRRRRDAAPPRRPRRGRQRVYARLVDVQRQFRVRHRSRGLGLRCREDYEELGVPKYAPSRPEDMFPDRWLGWDDYLGVRRPYDEGRRVARTLGISSELRWYTYALDRPAVLEDLRLPFRPDKAYGDAWRGWGDWLGTSV